MKRIATEKIRKRNKVVCENRKLIYKIANKFIGQCSEPPEDLHQIALIGLIKAADRFDHERGVAFSSFAVPYIEGEIRHFLRDQAPLMKVPRHALEKFGHVKRLRKRFAALGREMPETAVAKKLGISADQWTLIEKVNKSPSKVSWDELAYEPALENPDENEEKVYIYEALASLSTQQRYLISQRYFAGKTVAEISKTLKKTTTTVEALLAEALHYMNIYLSNNYGIN